MTNASALNSRIYGRLVELYPEDLRREYGDEMIFVFAEELRDANFARALRVWRNALSEFLRLALPGCLDKPAIRVPAISIAFALFSLTAELAMHCINDAPARFVIASLFPTYATMIVPLAVACACRTRAPLLLDLSQKLREK